LKVNKELSSAIHYIYRVIYYIVSRYANGKTENERTTRRSTGSIRKLSKSTSRGKDETSKREGRTGYFRVRERIRARKTSILQSHKRTQSTEQHQQKGKLVFFTNPFSIFYSKLKYTIMVIQLLDAFDTSPSFVIAVFRNIYTTRRM
jgi:hypothetical protein